MSAIIVVASPSSVTIVGTENATSERDYQNEWAKATQAIATCQDLEILTVRSVKMSTAVFQKLCSALSDKINLTSLRLEKIAGYIDLDLLRCALISARCSLKDLKLSKVTVTNPQSIEQLLQSSSLHELLSIRVENLDTDLMDSMYLGLTMCSHLEVLSLKNVENEAIDKICKIMEKNPMLKLVDFSENFFGKKEFDKLGSSLKTLLVLEELHLESCCFLEESAQTILQAIGTKRKMFKMLNVSNTELSMNTARELCEWLEEGPNMNLDWKVNVSGCVRDDEDLVTLMLQFVDKSGWPSPRIIITQVPEPVPDVREGVVMNRKEMDGKLSSGSFYWKAAWFAAVAVTTGFFVSKYIKTWK